MLRYCFVLALLKPMLSIPSVLQYGEMPVFLIFFRPYIESPTNFVFDGYLCVVSNAEYIHIDPITVLCLCFVMYDV